MSLLSHRYFVKFRGCFLSTSGRLRLLCFRNYVGSFTRGNHLYRPGELVRRGFSVTLAEMGLYDVSSRVDRVRSSSLSNTSYASRRSQVLYLPKPQVGFLYKSLAVRSLPYKLKKNLPLYIITHYLLINV